MSSVPVVTLSDDAEARLAVQCDLSSFHAPSDAMMTDFDAWMTVVALSDDALLRAAYPEIPRIETTIP